MAAAKRSPSRRPRLQTDLPRTETALVRAHPLAALAALLYTVPFGLDVFVVAAFALMVVQCVVPFFRVRLSELYVSAWYIVGAITFTLLAYPVGNFVPELLPGARGATYSGLWIHDAVGLYVTPFAVSIAYFVIPAV